MAFPTISNHIVWVGKTFIRNNRLIHLRLTIRRAHINFWMFRNNLLCYPTNNYTTWICYKNGYLCGENCTNPLNCGDCSSQKCINGMTYNPQTEYCEDIETGVYCTTTKGTYYQDCYQKDGNRCNFIDVTLSGKVAAGSCEDPGCPNGMVYGYVAIDKGYYGCIDDQHGNEGMSCFYLTSYEPNVCYYNGELCGRRCAYDGTNCGEVFLPQCALAGHCPQTGYDMSDGCTCDGSVTHYEGKDYCCPTGHEYINGACALI